jgi:hypothetical protein
LGVAKLETEEVKRLLSLKAFEHYGLKPNGVHEIAFGFAAASNCVFL